MAEVLDQRARQRQALIDLARTYVAALSQRLPVVAAAVVGSVARGDFNVWSDIDVVVVAKSLPLRAPDRTSALAEDAPPGVQPVGFTPEEFARSRGLRNPLTLGVLKEGVILRGAEFFRAAAAPRGPTLGLPRQGGSPATEA